MRWLVLAAVPWLLAGCDRALPPDAFAGSGPALAPEQWFARHAVSYGVFEEGGAPTGQFTTESDGAREPDGSLRLHQMIRLGDGTVLDRTWRLRRLDEHRYEATAGPVVGTATGEAYGRVFHWQYVIRLPPGDWLRTVEFEHWMYLTDADTLLNRFVVRKLGIVVARGSEVFRPAP